MYDWRSDIYAAAGALENDDNAVNFQDDSYVEELVQIATEKIVEENGTDYYSNPHDAVFEEAREFGNGGASTLWAIPLDSTLMEMLIEWYGGFAELSASARSSFTADSHFYFVTGMGYDIMSADLLGGTADGQAAREFDAFVVERC